MTKIGKLTLKNPVMLASGTCGYGSQMRGLADVGALGAVVTKTITLKPRDGNPSPRIVETSAGMINSIGLENMGIDDFISNKAAAFKKLGTVVIASVAGESAREYAELVERISAVNSVAAVEINLSCPNVTHESRNKKYKLTAQDPDATAAVVRAARKKTKKTLIAKLSPNVTDIKEIARAAEGAGADAITAVNTVFGVSVNAKTRRPNIGAVCGGLSGPAVKPIALYFVRDVSSCVSVPVIGSGGVMTADDAVEFMLCGAAAVQVGTATFVYPDAAVRIVKGLEKYMRENRVKNISSLIGGIII